MATPELQLSTESLEFRIDPTTARWIITDRQTGQRLLWADTGCFLTPVLDGVRLPLQPSRVERTGANGVRVFLTGAPLTEAVVDLEIPDGEDALDIQGSFRVTAPTQLNGLELIPPGACLNLYDVVNFRNRHQTPNTWPELLLGPGCETDTYSRDWQFAPHPSVLIFRKHETQLFLGALDLPKSFGLYFAGQNYRVKHCHLDYGAAPFGQPLAAGEQFTSPRIRLFIRHRADPHATYAEFGEMLVRSGRIPDPRRKTRHAWWREPLYCTWVDQWFKGEFVPPVELSQQTAQTGNPAGAALTTEFIRAAVAAIKRERLPMRTILIDGGWSVAVGQWEPHPARLPNLRHLVDELHAQGFKVVVWWNWAEIHPSAMVDPGHLIGNGKLNRHGCRVRDYSLPATQEEYLRPLFRKLFSPDPGCFDLDGVKTDFLADKVHPEMPVANPDWRGEENYFAHVTDLFYTEMKRHKPDAIHIGCAGNYWLADQIDINRTYDVASSDWREHEGRGRMLQATCPGCPVAYDFHNHVENFDEWFASARRLGASVQIGNVLFVKDDGFAAPRAADARYFEIIRKHLSQPW